MAGLSANAARFTRLLYPDAVRFIGVGTVILLILAVLIRVRLTYRTDLRATLVLQELNHPLLSKWAKWLTFMGNSMTLALIAAAAVGISWLGDDLWAGACSVLTLSALPINVFLKNIFDRGRPGEKEVRVLPGPRWGFSFPSGHSMASASFYGFLAFLIYLHMTDMPSRILFTSVFALLPVLIGLSRIYLGAHWLSDVVGGWALGLVIVRLVASIYVP